MTTERRVPTGGVFTVFRNLSKARRPFGYLGLYGREVAAGSEFVFEGQVEDQPGFNERKRKAFHRDAQEGRIAAELVPVEFATARPPRGYPTGRLGRSC